MTKPTVSALKDEINTNRIPYLRHSKVSFSICRIPYLSHSKVSFSICWYDAKPGIWASILEFWRSSTTLMCCHRRDHQVLSTACNCHKLLTFITVVCLLYRQRRVCRIMTMSYHSTLKPPAWETDQWISPTPDMCLHLKQNPQLETWLHLLSSNQSLDTDLQQQSTTYSLLNCDNCQVS